MSTIEDKRKKLLALREQTRVKQTDKDSRLNDFKSKRMGEGTAETELSNARDDPLLSQAAKP